MTTTVCGSCGQLVPTGNRFCPHCGASAGIAAYQPNAVVAAKDEKFSFMTALIVAFAILVAAAGLGFFLPSSDGDVLARQQVGPQGGIVTFENGGRIRVPAGALNTTQTITVQRSVLRKQATFQRVDGAAPDRFTEGTMPLYLFGPANITFARTVAVRLPVPAGFKGARIYLLGEKRLVFAAENTVRNGTIAVRIRGFRDGQIVPVGG